jgi:catechol 2,3-dioxygenase-like lactoylglutathione lyase family enzyme
VISGIHVLLYSTDAAADRAFLRDVLGWPSVDAGGPDPGWLIFKAPPAELGVHPTDGRASTEVHLMCDDVEATVAELTAKGVRVGDVVDAGFGRTTTLTLPSGAIIGLYQPFHPTAYSL